VGGIVYEYDTRALFFCPQNAEECVSFAFSPANSDEIFGGLPMAMGSLSTVGGWAALARRGPGATFDILTQNHPRGAEGGGGCNACVVLRDEGFFQDIF